MRIRRSASPTRQGRTLASHTITDIRTATVVVEGLRGSWEPLDQIAGRPAHRFPVVRGPDADIPAELHGFFLPRRVMDGDDASRKINQTVGLQPLQLTGAEVEQPRIVRQRQRAPAIRSITVSRIFWRAAYVPVRGRCSPWVKFSLAAGDTFTHLESRM